MGIKEVEEEGRAQRDQMENNILTKYYFFNFRLLPEQWGVGSEELATGCEKWAIFFFESN